MYDSRLHLRDVQWLTIGTTCQVNQSALTATVTLQDVLGNPISIDDSAETLSRVLDAKAVVVKGEKPQLQVRLARLPGFETPRPFHVVLALVLVQCLCGSMAPLQFLLLEASSRLVVSVTCSPTRPCCCLPGSDIEGSQ